MCRLWTVLVLLALALPARAIDTEALDKAISPYVNDETLGALYLDTTQLDTAALLKRFGELWGEEEKKIEEIRKIAQPFAETLKKQARGVVILNGMDVGSPDHTTILLLLDKDADVKALLALLNINDLLGPFRFEHRDGLLVGASDLGFRRLKVLKPSARPELARSLAGSDGLVRIVFSPPSILRRAFEEVFPELPKEVGGGSIKMVSQGIRAATLTFESPPKTKVELTIQASDAANAKALTSLLQKILEGLKEFKQLKEELPGVEKFIGVLKPETAGDKVTLKITEEELKTFTATAVARLRDNMVKNELTQNLKQIGIAIHNYH